MTTEPGPANHEAIHYQTRTVCSLRYILNILPLKPASMVRIPDDLKSLCSASLVYQEQADRYVIEVPASEVKHDSLSVGTTYRVGLIKTTTPDSHAVVTDSTDEEEPSDPTPTPPVSEGEVRSVEIESIGDQGDGIAKVDRGYVVIVPGAVPGDNPRIEIAEVKQNVAFAEVLSKDR